jgi:DNA gyrase/topoisomerase IV subunit B
VAVDCQVSFLIVQSKILQNAKCISCRDSAGTAKQGVTEFQAILPLRGKILNVEKAMHHKVFENEEIRNIFTALGVTVGTAEDSKALNMENTLP